MEKLHLKDNLVRISLASFIVVAAIIIFYRILDSLGNLFSLVQGIYTSVMDILFPFIMGAVLAYLLLPLCRWIERKFLNKTFLRKPEKTAFRRRMLSGGVSYIVILCLLGWFLSYLAPVLWQNMRDFVLALPDLYPEAVQLFHNLVEEIENATGNLISIQGLFDKLWENLQSYLVATSAALPSILTKIGSSIVDTLLDSAIALIVSYYLLLYGKDMGKSLGRLVRAALGEKRSRPLKRMVVDLDQLLGRYVQARLLESIIVFTLCLIFFSVTKIRFSVLLALVNGVFNLVPYFGPIVGWAITTLLVLLDNPIQALWAGLFVFAVQQYDGYYLGPRLQGKGLNLNAIWIIFSVSAGGALFGVPGMLLGAPVVAYIKLLLTRYADARLSKQEEKQKKAKQDNEIKEDTQTQKMQKKKGNKIS